MTFDAALYWSIILTRAYLERDNTPISDAEAEALLEYFGA